MKKVNGRNGPMLSTKSEKSDKVIDLSQIYQRKPIHTKTMSVEQVNYQSANSLQLQVRGSPKQPIGKGREMNQLPARGNVFSIKQ